MTHKLFLSVDGENCQLLLDGQKHLGAADCAWALCRLQPERCEKDQLPQLQQYGEQLYQLLERLEPDPDGDTLAYQRWCEQLDELEELLEDCQELLD